MLLVRNILFFSLVLVGLSSAGQNDCSFVLSGRVIDEHDGSFLTYANIYVLETKMGVVADSLGRYHLDGLCPGKYTIRCSHVGCDDIVDTIYVRGDMHHDFYPEHHSELLENTLVIGEMKKVKVSQDMAIMDQKELLEVKGQNLGNSLKEIPGVTTLNTGNNISKPVIHGMHSNRVLIMNNGVRHEGQQWGNEHAPEIDPLIAGKMSVIKGANSLRYGPDAIAGVILVDARPLKNQNGLSGEISTTALSNGRQGIVSAMLEGNHGKREAWRWRLQGSLKKGGNLNTPDYYLSNTGMTEQNFSYALGYIKDSFGAEVFYSQFNSDIGIFSGSHIGNLTDLENAFKSEQPIESADFTYEIGRPYQKIEHELFKARTYFNFSEWSKLELIYARQYNNRLEYDKDRSYNDSIAALNLPELQFEITTHTADLIYRNTKNPSWRFTSGISSIYQSNTYQGRFFIPNFFKYGMGVFAVEEFLPKNSKWQFEAGLRYDLVRQEVFIWRGDILMEPVFNYTNASGNLGGSYKVKEGIYLKGNAGIAWRPPNVNELYSNGLHHGSASYEIGDTSLTQETAYNLSLSTEITRSIWSLNMSLYYNYIDDYIYLRPFQPPTLTIRGAFPTFKYSQVDASLSGLDLSAGVDLSKKLRFSFSTSLVRGYNKSDKEYLVLIPPGRFEYNLRYKFNSGKSWKEPFVGFSLTHVLEQKRVPDNSDFVPPPPAYVLLGFRAGTEFRIGNLPLQLILRIDNILNQRYRDYMNRLRYFADDIGRNASISVTIPFNIINKSKTNENK